MTASICLVLCLNLFLYFVVEAADPCAQDTREMFTPEGPALDTSDNHEQRQDTVMTREKHEGEGEEAVSNNVIECVYTDRHDKEESSDTEHLESRRVEKMKDDAEDTERKTGAEPREGTVEAHSNDSSSGGATLKRPYQDLEADERYQKRGKSFSNCLTKDGETKDCDQEVEEKMKVNVESNKEGKAGDDELTSGSRKFSDGKLDMPEGDQGCKQGNRDSLYKRPEQQSEEMESITEEMEQGQDNESSDHASRVICEGQQYKLVKNGQHYVLEYVGVDQRGDEEIIKLKMKSDKEQGQESQDMTIRRHDETGLSRQKTKEGESKEHKEHMQSTEDLFPTQGESAGSRGLTENRREQMRQSDQHKRQDDRSGSYSEINDQAKKEKVNRSDSDGQSRNKTRGDEEVKTEMLEETLQGSKKSCNDEIYPERKSNLKTDTLTRGVHNLTLSHSKSASPGSQEHDIGQCSDSAGLSHAEETQNEPQAGSLFVHGKTSREKSRRRWWHLKSHKKKKRNTPGCFCIPKIRKNEDQMSD